jgi:hypothetical protein
MEYLIELIDNYSLLVLRSIEKKVLYVKEYLTAKYIVCICVDRFREP